MKSLRTLAAIALLAAPMAAQVPTTTADSGRRATVPGDSARARGPVAWLMPRDSALSPTQNQARGIDAEIRVALFELLADRPVPAMRRLQWLASSPVTMADSAAAAGALRGGRDLRFLLAEAQYRFGMDSAFRTTAMPLLESGVLPARYNGLLQSQLLLAAYRTGDYAGVVNLARSANDPATRGLAGLVSGLASYQLGNLAEARQSFAAAQQVGGPYAQYAQYMDILTALRTDTTQGASALQRLTTLASAATGEFADQVRLTAEQLAYERGAYDQAITLADAMSPNSGYAASALLTKAWAQYKADRVADAGQSFAAFADRYPQLPERDEARLMAAQALLQLGRTDEAGRVFATVADSTTGEVAQLRTTVQSAIADAARTLVAERAAGLLFIPDPAVGKTVVLQDRAGADPALLAMAVSDTVMPVTQVASTQLFSLPDVRARFDSVEGLAATFPRRVLFTPASASGNRAQFSSSVQALYGADVAIAIARSDLAQQLRIHQMQLALLRQLQAVLADRRDSLMAVSNQLQQNRAALMQLMNQLEQAHARIRTMLTEQATRLRLAATDNRQMIDSISTSLSASMTPEDRSILDLERQTVDTYRRTADLLLPAIDSAIRRHPAFALRDTVQMRADSVDNLLRGTQLQLATVEQLVDNELARLQQEPEAIRRLRGALAAAEARRSEAESRVVAAVDAELRARSSELLADLQRSTEAAEFGKASASFFQALDQTGQGNGAIGTTGAAAPTRTSAPVVTASSPTSKK